MVRAENLSFLNLPFQLKSIGGWIAAKFDGILGLPEDMKLGDGSRLGTGEYVNHRLDKDQEYKVFVIALTSGNVSIDETRDTLERISTRNLAVIQTSTKPCNEPLLYTPSV